jgi:hypothetical protein
MRRGFLAASRTLLLLLLPLVGCGEEAPGSGVFIGELRGGEVLVAAAFSGDSVIFYSCGRDAALSDSTVWLTGPVTDGTAELSEDGFDVIITEEDTTLHGTFDNGTGSSEVLLLREVVEPSVEGIFNLLEEPCRTAAIVFDDGGGVVVQGAHFCDAVGPFQQVTPLAPPVVADEMLSVSFDDGAGPQERLLQRTSLP